MIDTKLAQALREWLKANDPEGFGCACQPDGSICSTCRWAARIKPLSAALAEHDATHERATLSWGGFNAHGDPASIREVRRLVEFAAAREHDATPPAPEHTPLRPRPVRHHRDNFKAEAFKEALRVAAASRNVTMKEVSAATGVSETTLSRMNTEGRMPDAASFAALCGWMGANPDRYFDDAPPLSMSMFASRADYEAAVADATPHAAPADEADTLLRAIGLDPDTYRTEGGGLNLPKIKAALAHPGEYPRLSAVTDDMVSRFLCWPVPKDFFPDCGISFDGRKDDEWNKGKTWPIGTNLLTAVQARAMLEHVLAAPPAQPVALTDGQIMHIWDTHVGDFTPSYPFGKTDAINFARAVLAAAKGSQP
jgi:transcriptional regulator with XRE-family HTH domain